MTTHSRPATAATLFSRIAAGEDVNDAEIDRALPDWVEELSRVHWTPANVARRAAAFLTDERGPDTRILDVGSGAGKFCVVGAAATGARFSGVEQSARLIDVARAFASAAGAEDAVEFLFGEMGDVDWRPFHGVYFYNPFAEQFINDGLRDKEESCGWPLYAHYVRTAIAKLYLMPAGTRVATYHGFGATMPPGYDFVAGERFGEGVLRCYVRADPLKLSAPQTAEEFFDSPGVFEEPTEEMAPPRIDPPRRA